MEHSPKPIALPGSFTLDYFRLLKSNQGSAERDERRGRLKRLRWDRSWASASVGALVMCTDPWTGGLASLRNCLIAGPLVVAGTAPSPYQDTRTIKAITAITDRTRMG